MFWTSRRRAATSSPGAIIIPPILWFVFAAELHQPGVLGPSAEQFDPQRATRSLTAPTRFPETALYLPTARSPRTAPSNSTSTTAPEKAMVQSRTLDRLVFLPGAGRRQKCTVLTDAQN